MELYWWFIIILIAMAILFVLSWIVFGIVICIQKRIKHRKRRNGTLEFDSVTDPCC